MDFETLSFYKAISNSLLCLLDNPDTVHLLAAAGGLGFISIFSFFFFHVQAILPSSAGDKVNVQVFREKAIKAIACGAGQKTFGISVTQPSFNIQFLDLAGSTVYRKLSCLIQQPE